jgi:hypothetical protein
MTYSIGKVPVSSIQNIEASSSQEQSEVDLIDEDTNFLFLGAESAEDINIDFTLYEDGSSPRSIEEQREEIKELIKEEDINNTFEFSGKKGRISVESVSIPENSSQRNIVSGTIEGRFLPWPKHYPDDFPSMVVFLQGNIYQEMDLDGELTVVKLLEGLISGDLSVEGNALIAKLLEGEVDSSFLLTNEDGFGSEEYGDSTYGYTNPILSMFVSLESDVEGTLSIKSSLYGYNYGTNYESSEPILSMYVSTQGSIDGTLSTSTDLRFLSEFFYGNTYGEEYGGIIEDYGSSLYGKGVYSE